MKQKCVIYSRVSGTNQVGEGHYSLDVQKKLCERYAEENSYKVVEYFEDAGKSGTKIDGRTQFKKMLACVTGRTDIKAILVQDSDRFARNTTDHLVINSELKKKGIRLISISQPQIDDSPEGKLIETILASINTFHSDLTARKVTKGMEEKAEKGWLPTYAPVGYKNITHKDGSKTIEIDEERALFIKEAFEMYITGKYSVESINDILYRKGFRTRTGRKIERNRMFYLLQNPFYYGMLIWNKQLYAGNHKPIISKELFDVAQEIHKSRTLNKTYQRKHKFLLSSFVFCECGRKFTAEHHFKHKNKYSYYHCTRGVKCNSSKNMHCKDLEEQVEEKFKEIDFTKDFTDKLIGKLKEKYTNFKNDVDIQAQKLIKQKLAIQIKRDNMEQKFFANQIDREVYNRNKDKFNQELSYIDEEISKLQQKKEIQIGPFEEMVNFALGIYQTYKKNAYEVKRRFLGFFWEKFIVRGRIIIKAVPTPIFRAIQELQKSPDLGILVSVSAADGETKKFDEKFINYGNWSG